MIHLKKYTASLVMAILLLFTASIQHVNAQTYNLLSTSGGTVAGTNYNIVMSGNNTSGCVGLTTPLGSSATSASGTCTVNFTGGTPVYYVDIALDGADNQPSNPALNRELITVNGVTHTPSAANFICNGSGCTNASLFGTVCYSVSTGNYGVSGNYLQAANTNTVARCIYRVSSTVPITQIAITEDQPNEGGGVALSAYIISGLPTPCNAGTTAPTLSAITKANVCPATTVDLTSITASNLPASTSLTWHTGTPATTANKVATPTAVAAGTYYAAFFDATNNCYSGTSGSATTAVTATVASCSTPVTVGTPAVITGTTGTTVTGNPPTGVSGGTSPYTYSDGTGDALCTAPTAPTLALPTGRIIGLVGSTGAHSINTTGLGVGTYQYCIKVCDSTGTNCAISKHTIVVTAACNAGSAAPSLIKN